MKTSKWQITPKRESFEIVRGIKSSNFSKKTPVTSKSAPTSSKKALSSSSSSESSENEKPAQKPSVQPSNVPQRPHKPAESSSESSSEDSDEETRRASSTPLGKSNSSSIKLPVEDQRDTTHGIKTPSKISISKSSTPMNEAKKTKKEKEKENLKKETKKEEKQINKSEGKKDEEFAKIVKQRGSQSTQKADIAEWKSVWNDESNEKFSIFGSSKKEEVSVEDAEMKDDDDDEDEDDSDEEEEEEEPQEIKTQQGRKKERPSKAMDEETSASAAGRLFPFFKMNLKDWK